MKYYEDLIANAGANDLINFLYSTIEEYKSSTLYTEAVTAHEYFKKHNVTISQYRKLLYKVTGEAEVDNYSANYKFCNGFFPIFVKQENSFLLGNGVTFNNKTTKDKLGGDDFDSVIYAAGEYALWGIVSFLFFNLDHVDVFKSTEFVPLFSAEDGALHAGIRFWQVASDKPLRATLYEEDGYTQYIWREGAEGEVFADKQAYKVKYKQSVADGTEIYAGENYPAFPIVPLWANREHQSELTGLREKIDGYDLIQSGLCNTIDDASLIYWTLQNSSGMDEVSLAEFLDQIKRVKAAVLDEDGAKAEAHTLEVPYQATQVALNDLRDSLYRDAMALDTDKLSAGNVTATAIESAYENLELKCDGYEYCVTEAIKGLLELIQVEDSPTYHRRKTTNQPEVTNMVLAAAQYLDDETILKHLPFLNIDEIEEILKRKDKEEAERFTNAPDEETEEGQTEDEGIEQED